MSEEVSYDSKPKLVSEDTVNRFVKVITEHSTALLLAAVVLFFINQLFGIFSSINATTGVLEWHVAILGMPALGEDNLIVIKKLGGFFAIIQTLLNAFIALFAGLSFAAVCFDEEKNIFFRVISVAALMLIMYGGLAIF